MSLNQKIFPLIARFAWMLCLGVVVLGAFVRLSDAGLGCPDWPGCYGQLLVPEADHAVEKANAAYPHRPVEVHKAWKEMIHRYFASGVGLAILLLLVTGWKERLAPRGFLVTLLALVCFQGILGMWTVTWQLKPLAVSAHLIGGMSTLAMLTWLNARLLWPAKSPQSGAVSRSRLGSLAAISLLLLFVQIFLGGWTSSNYAALACPDFPTCHQQWWPETDFEEAFVLWRGLGQNYEFGVLDSPARTAIHLTHRIGAIVISMVFLGLIAALWRAVVWRGWASAVLLALVLQVTLGITTVLLSLPLVIATAHNAGAALLVILLTALNARLRSDGNG